MSFYLRHMKRFLPTIFTIKNKIIGCSLSRAVILLILFFICNPFGISAQTAEINPNETCLEAISSNNVIEFKGSYRVILTFLNPTIPIIGISMFLANLLEVLSLM